MSYKNYLNNHFFRRGFALYIDFVLIAITTLLYLFLCDKKGPTVECDNFLCWNYNRIFCFEILFYCIYFLLMEFFFSFTIGKLILGLYVSNTKKKAIFWGILIRTMLRLIPLNLISFIFNKERKFWHETLSKTFTLRKS